MTRGEVFWADTAPGSGPEQAGRRLVIVVSHDGFNQVPEWRSVLTVPISATSSSARFGPTVVGIPSGIAGMPKIGYALCHQVTALDRAKLTKRAGALPPEVLKSVEEGLKAALDLD
jgi:mRNA interferase MazF